MHISTTWYTAVEHTEKTIQSCITSGTPDQEIALSLHSVLCIFFFLFFNCIICWYVLLLLYLYVRTGSIIIRVTRHDLPWTLLAKLHIFSRLSLIKIKYIIFYYFVLYCFTFTFFFVLRHFTCSFVFVFIICQSKSPYRTNILM